MRILPQRVSRIGVCSLAAAALLLTACASTKKFYEGAERAESDVVRLQATNSYVFSINGRRTDAAKDRSWTTLAVLPGTQRLIVQLDEDMASRYGHVGVRLVFCARAGHTYTVYPVIDVASRTWQPAVRDDVTLVDVEARSCESDAPAAAPAPAPKPVQPPASAAAAKTAPPTAPAAQAPAPPPTAASPPPPATSAAPVAPGTLAAGGRARLRSAAHIRASADAAAVKGLEPGVIVTLKVVLKKDTGPWWYVNAPGASGWVHEAELDPGVP